MFYCMFYFTCDRCLNASRYDDDDDDDDELPTAHFAQPRSLPGR